MSILSRLIERLRRPSRGQDTVAPVTSDYDAARAEKAARKAEAAGVLISQEARDIIAQVRAANLTYCGPPKLENVVEAAERVLSEGVEGDFIEAGVALGGSAIVLARVKRDRQLRLYDVFEMIPPPSEKDDADAHERYREIVEGKSSGLGGGVYYGYMEALKDQVAANLSRFGHSPDNDRIALIPGTFEETLHPDGPVAFAHIDCDWYDSVKVCIDRIAPRLSPGGMIAFDDYSSYSGCRKAVDEWLERDDRMETFLLRRSIVLRRKNGA